MTIKIYRKVVIDIATGDTLEEDSYEYDGPVAECKGEAKDAMYSQNSTSFSNLSQYSSSYQNFYNTLTSYMGDRFGRQSDVFNTLTGSLNKAISPGVPTKQQIYGGGAGGTGTGAGASGGGGRTGGGAGAGEGGGPNSLLEKNNLLQYGYDPSLYTTDYNPQAFYGAEEEAMRSEASDQNAAAYQNANMAYGQRALQLGGYAPGIDAANLANLEGQQAASEASGQREVTIAGANNMRQEMAHLADLKAQLALGQAQGMSAAAQLRLQDVIARRQEALQRRAIGAGSAAASAANAERAREFNLSMQSDNFFRGIGALSGTAGLMSPLDYGQLGLGSLGGGSNLWSNAYNQTANFMTQQAMKPSIWQTLAGAAVGGLAGGLTGGIGGLFGGASSAFKVPTATQPWSLSAMSPY